MEQTDLRRHFASQALMGLLSSADSYNWDLVQETDLQYLCKKAWKIADFMVATEEEK